jgi:hypothetical protein
MDNVRTQAACDPPLSPPRPGAAPADAAAGEVIPVTRDDFYATLPSSPNTPEEVEAYRARLTAMRNDPRYGRFWPLLDRLLAEPPVGH